MLLAVALITPRPQRLNREQKARNKPQSQETPMRRGLKVTYIEREGEQGLVAGALEGGLRALCPCGGCSPSPLQRRPPLLA